MSGPRLDGGRRSRRRSARAATSSGLGVASAAAWSNAGACSPSRILAATASTVRRPWTAPFRSTTIPVWTSASSIIDRASLSVVRRFTIGETGLAIASVSVAVGRDVAVGDPAERPVGRRRPGARSAAGRRAARRRASAAGSPGRAVTAGRSSTSETRSSDSRLRPRSWPTNRATNSDAGAARISSGGPNWARIAAGLEDGDEVAHLDRLVDVVGHEQDRLGDRLLEAQELVLEAVADDRVDRAERLVHEHDRRVRGERPGDADALPLAAATAGSGSGRGTSPDRGRPARAAPRTARAGAPSASRAGAARSRRCRRSSGAGTGRPAG